MATFSNKDELYKTMEELWQRIKADPDMAKRLIDSRMAVRFVFRDPDGTLTIDSSDGKDLTIQVGETEKKVTIEVEMQSDFAHKFWLGNENPAAAMLQGKIVSRGPINKALALLPAIRPAFDMYPTVIEDVKKAA